MILARSTYESGKIKGLFNKEKYKTGVINDPLGQTHSLTSSEHCLFTLEICFVLKSGDGRMNGHVQKQ